ncbi:MAG TPA: hypothetical protein VK686_04470 [Bryobacteraceae bacterium]|jgi:hypothetical protein|nr:hypothetical protein [Bryobacteraceae bacterium]
MHALNGCKLCSEWLTIGLALTWPVFAAGPALVVDRGLAQANLNNVSGEYRSNIRWGMKSGFLGDDFTVGVAGEHWVIDSIRVWNIPGVNATDPQNLGDVYQDVRLYLGGSDGGLTPIVTGLLTPGSSVSNNPNVQISDATATGVVPYDDFGTNMRVWQIDFTQLNLSVSGGAKVRFGAWGLGRPVPDSVGETYKWFNAASNAPLAVANQDGADGQMLIFTSGGRFESAFDGKNAGWDKSSDVDVQVFGHRANN